MSNDFIENLDLPIADREKIYCLVRKMWVVKTPEEEVRQYFIKWLSTEKGFPINLMRVEKQIDAGSIYRFDLFIQAKRKIMLCEFKAPHVPINQKVLEQLIRYQKSVKADYFLLSNGVQTFSFFIDKEKRKIEILKDLPTYMEI